MRTVRALSAAGVAFLATTLLLFTPAAQASTASTRTSQVFIGPGGESGWPSSQVTGDCGTAIIRALPIGGGEVQIQAELDGIGPIGVGEATVTWGGPGGSDTLPFLVSANNGANGWVSAIVTIQSKAGTPMGLTLSGTVDVGGELCEIEQPGLLVEVV